MLPTAEARGLRGSWGSQDTSCPLLLYSAVSVTLSSGYSGAVWEPPATFLGRLGFLHQSTSLSEYPLPPPPPLRHPLQSLFLSLLPSLPHLTTGSSTPGFSLALGYRTVCPAPQLGPFLSTSLLVPWGPQTLCISPESSAPCSQCPQQPPVETWQLTFRAVLGAVRPLQRP